MELVNINYLNIGELFSRFRIISICVIIINVNRFFLIIIKFIIFLKFVMIYDSKIMILL